MASNVFRNALVCVALYVVSAPASASDATELVSAEARRQGVPVPFALKIAKAESGTQCGVNNRRSTASGPLQILASTARALGFHGNIRRASCATQTHYGMKHLALCYRGAGGNQALAKRCHQVGVSVLHKKNKKRRK